MKLIAILTASIILASTVSYPLADVFAATYGVGEKAWVEPQRELRGTFYGVLEFDKAPDGFCNIDIQSSTGLLAKRTCWTSLRAQIICLFE